MQQAQTNRKHPQHIIEKGCEYKKKQQKRFQRVQQRAELLLLNFVQYPKSAVREYLLVEDP